MKRAKESRRNRTSTADDEARSRAPVITAPHARLTDPNRLTASSGGSEVATCPFNLRPGVGQRCEPAHENVSSMKPSRRLHPKTVERFGAAG